MHQLNGTLHGRYGGGHQRRQSHQRGVIVLHRLEHRFLRHILAQVQHIKAVVLQQHLHDIFANIVNIAVHGGKHNFVGAFLLLAGGAQLFLDHIKSRFGRVCAHQQLGQKYLILLKSVAHHIQCRDNMLVDDL